MRILRINCLRIRSLACMGIKLVCGCLHAVKRGYDNCILLRVYSLGSGTMNGRKRQNKDAYTLHKPVRLNFRRRMTFTIGIDNLWQIFQNCQSINPNAVKSFYRFVTKNYSISIAVPHASVAINLMLGGTLVESM